MTARGVAFWVAVVLPFASIAILLGGTVTPTDLVVVAVLMAANVVALYVGHGYASSSDTVDRRAYPTGTDGGTDAAAPRSDEHTDPADGSTTGGD